jgi:hypothetical protein
MVGGMVFSFLYLAVWALFGALVRSRRGLHVKDTARMAAGEPKSAVAGTCWTLCWIPLFPQGIGPLVILLTDARTVRGHPGGTAATVSEPSYSGTTRRMFTHASSLISEASSFAAPMDGPRRMPPDLYPSG